MGAEQSSSSKAGAQPAASTEPKACYYELLGVERTATDDEIRKAYRRRALELHPDRNYNDVENATRKFAEVQSAYEVLSDPQERSWYDSHRDVILRGEDPSVDKPSDQNISVTSAQDLAALMSRFGPSTPFTDEPHGFFGTLRRTFATLADEENAACAEQGFEARDYPDFGLAEDKYEDVVRPFYNFWMGFGTKKAFSWRDRFRYSDAPDRKIRRLMERENKRHRDEGIREFNDAVRKLVTFVRARDPRYLRNVKTDAERQQDLRNAAAAQAARARAARQAQMEDYTPNAWAQSHEPEEQVGGFSESDESVVEEIECVICNKTFKSEKQYESHEKSKKHVKAVQQLKRQMRKENKLFDLDEPTANNVDDGANSSNAPDDQIITDAELREALPPQHGSPTGTSGDLEQDVSTQEALHLGKDGDDQTTGSTNDISDDDDDYEDNDYAPREQIESRLGIPAVQDDMETISHAMEDSSIAGSGKPTPHIGKAKARRAKKATRQENAQDEKECATCQATFSSKNKLFDHIKELRHAQAVPATRGKVSSKGRKKR